MVKCDKVWMFTRGLPAILLGQLAGLFGFSLANRVKRHFDNKARILIAGGEKHPKSVLQDFCW